MEGDIAVQILKKVFLAGAQSWRKRAQIREVTAPENMCPPFGTCPALYLNNPSTLYIVGERVDRRRLPREIAIRIGEREEIIAISVDTVRNSLRHMEEPN